ncbi:DNA circularization N-terminal domain-containing protein [Kaistia dalseonensis]|uniref:DNA circulation N-terminal domain-containing protein n=1 Tax=Kaistia dalseonensis TaxID=410840 RepID=A0ABU0HCC9_9HYPH|nr:DNA circularization N-terminal domain-containing protein [Kaistia dalseonensis]MCX5497330.1 DNA circularization N-terminal domain-containing protein [Kaistia dalseonensis]MDQ0439967.1 hypothetical protein [Kaistia dalseonensis]
MAWDSADLLPGLRPAMYRGVSFHMPDTSIEVGRRTLVTLFPGLDAPAFEDLGRHDGPISVAGVLLGDDYVAQAFALQAAFQAAGPGTLLHPWLGEMSVVIADPAQIRFSSRALRLVQFEVSFLRADLSGGAIISTLAGLLSSVTALVALPALLVSAVVGAVTMAVGTWSALVNTATAVADLVTAAVSASPANASLTVATETAAAAVASAAAGSPGAASAELLATAIGDLIAPIASVAIGEPAAAVGSASIASTTAARFDARGGATLLLDLSADIHALPIAGAYDATIRLAAELAALAQAVRAAAEIDYESRQDATDWLDRLSNAIDRANAGAVDLAPLAPASAALAMDALSSMASALSRDMHEVIGRLPSVYRLAPPSVVSAWLIAQHVAGDDPGAVTAMMNDIVRRNRLRHPGLVSPDGVEVLS